MSNCDPVKVCIVDDDDAIRESISILLDCHGIPSESYARPDDFLAAFDDSNSYCLIIDIRLPGMSGFELVERLGDGIENVYCIMISGHGDQLLHDSAKSKGIDKFFQKPFNSTELVEAVKSVYSPQ